MIRAHFARQEHLLPDDETDRRMIVHGIHEHLSDVLHRSTIAPEWSLTNAVRGLLALEDYGARALSDVEADGIFRALDRVTPAALDKIGRLMPLAVLRAGLASFRELVGHHVSRQPKTGPEAHDLVDRTKIFANELHNVSLRKLMERRAQNFAKKATAASATPTPTATLQPSISDDELDLLPPELTRGR